MHKHTPVDLKLTLSICIDIKVTGQEKQFGRAAMGTASEV